jgi:hypothetical protein
MTCGFKEQSATAMNGPIAIARYIVDFEVCWCSFSEREALEVHVLNPHFRIVRVPRSRVTFEVQQVVHDRDD